MVFKLSSTANFQSCVCVNDHCQYNYYYYIYDVKFTSILCNCSVYTSRHTLDSYPGFPPHIMSTRLL